MSELLRIQADVLRFMRGEDGTFDQLLTAVVSYQRRWNAPLRDYWSGRAFVDGSDLDTIPGVPTEVFRHVELVSSEGPVVRTFRTSGTTSGKRGESHRLSTRVYDESALLHARATLLPAPPYAFVNAVLDPVQHDDSSLSHMVALFNHHLSLKETPYFLRDDGLADDEMRAQIRATKTPTVVFGTAFALAHFAELSEKPTPLPAGSSVIETGGFKGKRKRIERDELYRMIAGQFELPLEAIRSEYSMTELSSQLYSLPWDGVGPQLLVPPHWCRVTAVDPTTLAPLAAGQRGLLRFVDLANVDTVVAIQTSDLGETTSDGKVILHGRAPGAASRGCSLATEEILALTERAGST